jgi:hypothetical protein
MIVNPKHKGALLSIAIVLLMASTLKAQTNTETFGQNRIQYRKFDWKFYETKHFRIYHYDAAGRQLARYVAEQVEDDIRMIEKRLGGEFPRKFKIMLYNNYDEYRQTNIGRKFESQLKDIPAGTIDIVGDKLVVYFDGVHTDLRRQTREGMAKVVIERMLFGENVREVVKNAVLMNLPRWVFYGYTAYLVDGWDTKSNSDWKNMLVAKPKANFYEQAEINPDLAGRAFWKYMSDRYGENTMRTLLFNMQQKSSLNQGIKITLGQKVKVAFDSTITYFRNMYAVDEQNQEKPDTTSNMLIVDIPHDGTQIRNFKVAPKGNDAAYVAWKNGEYKVYMQNTQGPQARYSILEGGRLDYNEQPDPNYPLLAWSNSGYKLAILFKKGNETRLRIYNSIKARIENYVIPANRFDRVLSMTFNEDDDKLVFSAIKKSQTDLYVFTIRGSRMTNITNDAWDDIDPWFVSGGSKRGILFLSNRPKPNIDVPLTVNELPTGPMNVFFYDTKTKRKELIQMSFETKGNVSQPIQYGSENFAYLYDGNGIQNQYVVSLKRNKRNMDSAVAIPVTNYNSNVISHQYNPASRQTAHVVQDGNRFVVHYKPLQIPGKNAEAKSLMPTVLSQTEKKSEAANGNNEPVLKSGNVFQSEFKDEHKTDQPVAVTEQEETEADSTYMKMKAAPYRLSFKPDFVTLKLDNSILFNRYQSFKQGNGEYQPPDLSGMLTISLDDLMEDYRITAGIRLPFNFNASTYFIQYENVKKRLDWNLLYLRSNATNNKTYFGVLEEVAKNNTNMLQGTISYPLDRIRSLRFQATVRQDKFTLKAQDTISLTYENILQPERIQYWGIARGEYVFDNTKNPIINIYRGYRYKFFAEYFRMLNNEGGGCVNFGTDFRYYAKIYKNFIWAARFAAAMSDGSQKILYHVGGVDNWISPKYSSYVPVRPYENYGFQTIATNLRGYELNSRNGNSYAVFNTEFRLPALTTFLKRPIQSQVLRNLQVVTFLDMGSAWEGILPNADRLKNNKVLPDPAIDPHASVILNITDETGGVGVGYGAGLRTMMFGYFMRLDAAWNIEGRTKPILYFSIGTDF